jgi:hypothetical protein
VSDADNSERQGPKRPVGRPFQPGQSGNPGGKAKGNAEIRELARKHAPEAIAGLLALARGAKVPAAVRRAAWVDVLDRGLGRPTVGEPDSEGREVSRVEYTWASEGGE